MDGERRLDPVTEADLVAIRYQLPTIFSPGAPVRDAQFLAGRRDQIDRALATVAQPGQHAAIYGERGVGKTSLATLIHDIWSKYIRDEEIVAARVSCNPGDTFESIWKRVADSVLFDMKGRDAVAKGNGAFAESSAILAAEEAQPATVTRFLSLIGRKVIIVIDEFDTVLDKSAQTLMASTIKELSDFVVDATLFLVGVADTVDDLVDEHASIERSLVQIFMPRMSPDELGEIVTSRLARVGMLIGPRELLRIAALSQGFPYYAHLLGLHAATTAIDVRHDFTIQAAEVNAAIRHAIAQSQQTILSDYVRATRSPRPENLYRQTLLACALTPADDLGYFAPGDLKAPMSKIVRRQRDVPDFIKQLRALGTPERGPALDQVGGHRTLRYRFHNALLKPYVVFRGVEENMITEQDAYCYAQPELARQLMLLGD